MSKLCVKELFKEKVGNTKYELIGGILNDGEEDYVAVKKLMESEEIIGMAESDVLIFCKEKEIPMELWLFIEDSGKNPTRK